MGNPRGCNFATACQQLFHRRGVLWGYAGGYGFCETTGLISRGLKLGIDQPRTIDDHGVKLGWTPMVRIIRAVREFLSGLYGERETYGRVSSVFVYILTWVQNLIAVDDTEKEKFLVETGRNE